MNFRYFNVRGKYVEKLEPELLKLGMQIVRPAGRGFIVKIPEQDQLEQAIKKLANAHVRTSITEVENFNDRFEHSAFRRVVSFECSGSDVILRTNRGEFSYKNVSEDAINRAQKLAKEGKLYEILSLMSRNATV